MCKSVLTAELLVFIDEFVTGFTIAHALGKRFRKKNRTYNVH